MVEILAKGDFYNLTGTLRTLLQTSGLLDFSAAHRYTIFKI